MASEWTLLGESDVYPKFVKFNIGLYVGKPDLVIFFLIPQAGAELFSVFLSNPGE